MKISEIQQSIQVGKNNQKVNSEKQDEKLLNSSKQMEGLFLSYMIKAMEKTIPESGLTGSKNNLAKMMFSSVLGKELANNGGIGLAKHLYESLKDNDNADALKDFKLDDHSDILHNLKLPEALNE